MITREDLQPGAIIYKIYGQYFHFWKIASLESNYVVLEFHQCDDGCIEKTSKIPKDRKFFDSYFNHSINSEINFLDIVFLYNNEPEVEQKIVSRFKKIID